MTKAINECKPFLEVEKQVCSLPLAIKLKNLGVNQETVFYYEASKDKRQDEEGKWRPTYYDIIARSKHDITAFAAEYGYKRFISAYTAAELGELLPSSVLKNDKSYRISIVNGNGLKYIDYTAYENGVGTLLYGYPMIEEDTEANARAQMLIYLLENNLLTL